MVNRREQLPAGHGCPIRRPVYRSRVDWAAVERSPPSLFDRPLDADTLGVAEAMMKTILTAGCFLALLLPADPAVLTPRGARPNILFIMTDDHAAHAIGAYGSKVNQTPNL